MPGRGAAAGAAVLFWNFVFSIVATDSGRQFIYTLRHVAAFDQHRIAGEERAPDDRLQLRQIFLDYNGSLWGTDAFKAKEKELLDALASKQTGVEEKGAALLANIK